MEIKLEYDFSSMRPFDYALASAGEPVITGRGHDVSIATVDTHKHARDENGNPLSVLAVTEYNGASVEFSFYLSNGTSMEFPHSELERLYMKPLCWVENRAVYRGDILYSKTVWDENGNPLVYCAEYVDTYPAYPNSEVYLISACEYSGGREELDLLTWVRPNPVDSENDFPIERPKCDTIEVERWIIIPSHVELGQRSELPKRFASVLYESEALAKEDLDCLCASPARYKIIKIVILVSE